MRAAKTTDTVIANCGDVAKAFAQAAHVAIADLFLSLPGARCRSAPNCASPMSAPTARWSCASTQDIYSSRDMLAAVLGLPVKKVRVQYYEGSGTYRPKLLRGRGAGRRIMSQAVGKPVRVQYMRWDEHGWDNYGPAHLADVRAGVDADGKLVAYEYHGWQHGWTDHRDDAGASR